MPHAVIMHVEYFLYKLKGFVDKGYDNRKLISPMIVPLSTAAYDNHSFLILKLQFKTV